MAIRSQDALGMKDGSYTVIGRSRPEYERQIQKFGQKLDEKDAMIRALEDKCSMKDRTISEMGQEISRLEKTIRKLSRRDKKLQQINENQAKKNSISMKTRMFHPQRYIMTQTAKTQVENSRQKTAARRVKRTRVRNTMVRRARTIVEVSRDTMETHKYSSLPRWCSTLQIDVQNVVERTYAI